MACDNKGCFKDYVIGSPTEVDINVILEPLTTYTWELSDGYGNYYYQDFTTDANGAGLLDMSILPAGFANPTQAPLTIRVKTDIDDCAHVLLPIVQNFDCIEMSFRQGLNGKDFVACPVNLATEGPRLDTPQNFSGTNEDSHSVLTWDAVVDATHYVVKQNGVTIFTGPALTHDAIGLTNGIVYQFTVTAQAAGFTDSLPAVITVIPQGTVVYVLYHTDAHIPTEAEILAGEPHPIAGGTDYSIQFTNPISTLRFIKVFEFLTQPVKVAVSFGIGTEPIGPAYTFNSPVTVTQFRGYITTFATANPDSLTTFLQ